MKRILSIDGGGIRGIIPARILIEIQGHFDKPLWKIFDLIAGTSTGGIITLLLGSGLKTSIEILDLYMSHGKKIFQRNPWSPIGITNEKYKNDGLIELLVQYFGHSVLGQAKTKVMVTTSDLVVREPIFLKSWKEEHQTILMRSAAQATASPPCYFEPVNALDKSDGQIPGCFIDGGVHTNNPAMSALAEAKRLWPGEEFQLVSLGTGDCTRPILYEDAKDFGAVEWLQNGLISIFMDESSKVVDYQCRRFLDDEYMRFQGKLETARDDMDDVSKANALALIHEADEILEDEADQFDNMLLTLKK